MLTLAAHSLLVHPYAIVHAWKAGVRAALLILAAASAAVVAWAGAIDLRLLGGSSASNTLTAGSYTVAVLLFTAIAVLVFSVGMAMLRGVREENAQIMAMKALPARATRVRHTRVDDPGIASNALSSLRVVSDVEHGRGNSSAPLDPVANAAFAVHAVRRPHGGGGPGSSSGLKRRRRQKRPVFSDPALAAAAVALPDAASSGADITAACEGIVSSLRHVAEEESTAASAALLPGLTARLDAALCGAGAADVGAITAICQAMAALSDHAEATTLSRLGRSGIAVQLVTLLRMSVSRPEEQQNTPIPPPPALPHALWLLGNVAADESVAVAFTNAGGAGLLVELLQASAPFPQPDSPGPTAPEAIGQWADESLQVCVAIASITAHAEAAASLRDEGMISALARFLPTAPGVENECTAAATPEAGGSARSRGAGGTAEAEAACHALINVIKHVAASGQQGRSGEAARVCSELAAGGVVATCTAALQCSAFVMADPASSPLPSSDGGLAVHAAEVLVCAVQCAVAAAAAGDRAPAGGADAVSAFKLVEQAEAAGTSEAVQALWGAMRGIPEHTAGRGDCGEEVSPALRTLEALSSELQSLLQMRRGAV